VCVGRHVMAIEGTRRKGVNGVSINRLKEPVATV
jgi:hypothetical protein